MQFSRIHHAWHIRADSRETGDSLQPSSDAQETFSTAKRITTYPLGSKRHLYVLPSAFVELFLVLTEYLVLVHAVLDPKVETSEFLSSSRAQKDPELVTTGPKTKYKTSTIRIGTLQPIIEGNSSAGIRGPFTQTPERPDANIGSDVGHSSISTETHNQFSQTEASRYSKAATGIQLRQERRGSLRPFQSSGRVRVAADTESDTTDPSKQPSENIQRRTEDMKTGKTSKPVQLELSMKIQRANAPIKKLQAQLKSLMSEGFHELIKMEGFAYGEYADH